MAKRVVRKKEKQDYTWWIVLLVAVVAVITLLFNSGIARFSPEEPVVINPEDDAMMAEDGRMADDPYARPEDDDFVVAMDSDGDDNFAAPPLDADVGGGVSCTWTCACHFELSYSGKCVDSQGWSVDPEVHSPYGT